MAVPLKNGKDKDKESAASLLLNKEVVAGAVGPVERPDEPSLVRETEKVERPNVGMPRAEVRRPGIKLGPHAVSTGEPADRTKKFTFTASTLRTFNDLLATYKEATSTEMTASHLARAICHVLEHAKAEIKHMSAAISPMQLPSNAKGREDARDVFEKEIAANIIEGLRRASSMGRE